MLTVTVQTHNTSDAAPTGYRQLPHAVWLLVAARAVNRLGAFALSFLAVVLVDDFGASVGTAGLMMAVFGLATIPSRLAGGRLADRLGRVPTICLGLLGCAVSLLWIAASPSLVPALAGVVALGLAFELYEPPSQALVADLTDDAQRPLAYGLLSAALAAGGAAAGLLAVALGGWGLRTLLVADAVTCLLAAGVVLAFVHDPAAGPGSSPVDPVGPGAGGRPSSPWRDRGLLAMLASGTGFALVYLGALIALPLTFAARGLPAEQAGLVLTASALTMVAAQPLLRWRLLQPPGSDGFRALTVGYVVLAVGLAGTAVATSTTGLVAAGVVGSLGDLLLMGHAWTIVSRLAPADARGAYLAAYGLSWGFAAVIAPLVVTQLLAEAGPTGLWLGLAAGSLVLAAAQPAVARAVSGARRRRRG